MVIFGRSVKKINGKYLERRSSVDTKGGIVNNTSIFITTYLDTSMKSQKTISSTDMNKNNNNIYQGLI